LRKALESKAIRQSLLELVPAHRQYGLLKAQLARYRAAAGNTSATGALPVGHLSDDQLRSRLAFYALMDTVRTAPAEPGQPDRLGMALKQFQQLNGLDTTGVVDDSTRAALNRPATDVIQTLRINMERLRWQPESLGDRYVAVNVPGSELKVYENEAETLHMRVIVGNEYAVTPIFTDTLEYIIFSPDWTIPLTIARKEILPVLQRNPKYLQERNMVLYDSWDTVQAKQLDPREIDWRTMSAEAFGYRIVQQPGETNPMGRMKFMLPNPLFIYLHDTPASFLFQSKDRALSHGCIRVERPDELANFLLAGNRGWNADKLNEYTRLKAPKRVDLGRKLPIAVTYHTAWVDQAGRLNLRPDVYGLDRKQLEAIGGQKPMLSNNTP
jgi:murein L,D-transpeptidase YcbB/YkuD